MTKAKKIKFKIPPLQHIDMLHEELFQADQAYQKLQDENVRMKKVLRAFVDVYDGKIVDNIEPDAPMGAVFNMAGAILREEEG